MAGMVPVERFQVRVNGIRNLHLMDFRLSWTFQGAVSRTGRRRALEPAGFARWFGYYGERLLYVAGALLGCGRGRCEADLKGLQHMFNFGAMQRNTLSQIWDLRLTKAFQHIFLTRFMVAL